MHLSQARWGLWGSEVYLLYAATGWLRLDHPLLIYFSHVVFRTLFPDKSMIQQKLSTFYNVPLCNLDSVIDPVKNISLTPGDDMEKGALH